MNSVSFEKFPRLFEVEDVLSVNNYRKELDNIDFDWKTQDALCCDAIDLKIESGQYRYRIASGGVAFECLFFPAQSSKLVVSLCGGGRGARRYPEFLRWKYYHYYDANYLCIDDPMYEIHKDIFHVLWYYGDKKVSFIDNLYDVVNKFIEKLNINVEDVIFLGSSGGGTAAIHMANKFAGSCCVAINPQFYPALWNEKVTSFFLNKLDVDLSGDDEYGRHRVFPCESRSRYFITLNAASKGDQCQFLPMFKELGIPMKYGLSQCGNIVTWLHHSNGAKPHSANPERLEFVIMRFLNEELKNGKNVNHLDSLFYIINEYMNLIYVQRKHIEKHKKEIKALNLKLAEERFSLKHIVAKCRYWVMSKICLGKKRQHYKAKLKKLVTPSGK